MSETYEIDYLLTVDVEVATGELRKLESMIMRLAHMVQRVSGNEDLDKFMAKIQQVITYIRALQTALQLMQAAMIPGAGWLSIAYAGFAFANAGFAGYDMLRGY